jgi:hypothetical protein
MTFFLLEQSILLTSTMGSTEDTGALVLLLLDLQHWRVERGRLSVGHVWSAPLTSI